MKIKRIAIENLKGRDIATYLAPVTLVTGANFEGKTALLLGIRLALTGWHKSVGASAQGIWRLAGNTERAGELSVELELDDGRNVSARWERNDKGQVRTSNVRPVSLPDLLSEPTTFFGLTYSEKLTTLFRAIPDAGAGLTSANLARAFAAIEAYPLAAKQTTLAEVRKLVEQLETSCASRAEAMEKLVGTLKSKAKLAKQEAEAASGMLRGLRSDGEVATDVTPELRVARLELETLLEARGKHAANVNHLKALRAQLEAAPDRSDALRRVREQLDVLEAKTRATAVEPAPDNCISWRKMVLDTEAALSVVEREFGTIQQRIVALPNAACCPQCGNRQAGWTKEARSFLVGEEQRLRTMRAKLEARLEDETTQLKRNEAWAKQLALSKLERQETDDQLTKAKAHLLFLEAEQRRRDELLAELAALGEQAETSEPAIARAHQRLNDLTEADRRWQQQTANDAKAVEWERQLLDNQCRRDVFEQAVKLTEALVTSETEAVVNAVLQTARRFTDGLLNSPVELRNGELGRRVSEQDRERGNEAEVGSWIPHQCFSGTEQLVAYAGFAVAVAHSAPFKLVLMDELGNVDDALKVQLLERMVVLVREGVIDQFVGVHPQGAWLSGLEQIGVKVLAL